MSLRERLREATSVPHRALEAEPFVVELASGSLPLVAYVGWLRTIAVIADELETAASSAEEPSVRALWTPNMRRLPLLRKDLEHFDEVPTHPAGACVATVLELVETVRNWSAPALVGGLYVFEGSILGGKFLAKRLAECYGLGDEGLAFVSTDGASVRARWDDFCGRLDALDLSASHRQEAVEAAAELFDALQQIAAGMHPDQASCTSVPQAINGDAGRHEVTEDPREVVAAVDAGVRTWNAYPYYEARYADRGRRFTRTDSLWLVTLAEETDEVRKERLGWLGGLLASRGMPSFLLEEHLRHLHEALCSAVPEREARYRGLLDGAEWLCHRRLEAMPNFSDIAGAFELDEPIANLGPVLAGAIADERLGVTGAVASLESWLTHPERFSATFAAAVREALERGRGS